MYTPSTRSDLPDFVARALRYYHLLTGKTDLSGGCLFAAAASVLESAELGIPAVFMAGSAQWRRVPLHLDDGVCSTHFAYMWEPEHPLSRPLVARLLRVLTEGETAISRGTTLPLPEVHCWCYWTQTGEVVDLTTGSLVARSVELGLGPWLAPHPPQYLIGSPSPDTRYTPNRQAMQLLARTALSVLRGNDERLAAKFWNHVISSAKAAAPITA